MCKLDPLGINDANLHVDKFQYRGSSDQVRFASPPSPILTPLLIHHPHDRISTPHELSEIIVAERWRVARAAWQGPGRRSGKEGPRSPSPALSLLSPFLPRGEEQA
jgi:hypothetical protein